MAYTNYTLMNNDIVSGIGSIEVLPEKLKKLGITKPLVVVDKDIVKTTSMAKLEEFLKSQNIDYVVYSDLASDPFDYMVHNGVKVFKDTNRDGIISFGGGSTMDTGKGISIMSVHEGNIIQYGFSTPNHLYFTKAGCPIIAIPTTSGTGSEVSRYAVITNSETHQKRNITSKDIVSKCVILDPTYATTMSKEVTAYTGMDALCHAIEAYCCAASLTSKEEISDTLALRAIKLINENLPIVYNNPEDVEARFNMQWGALLAGLALNIGTGECHGIGAYLSKYYKGVAHGTSVGIPLPYTMNNTLEYCPDRFKDVAEAMGCDIKGKSVMEAAKMAPKAVKELLEKIEFPKLKDICPTFEEVKNFCAEACTNSCCVRNGRIVTEDKMVKTMKDCYFEVLD